MNNGTKEIKTRERKSQNSLVTLMNVLQTRLTIPHLPPPVGPDGHTPPPDNATVAKPGPGRNSAGEKTDQS